MMNFVNALFRIRGILGDPPEPFEKPRDDMDFWVLELGWPGPCNDILVEAEQVLETQRKVFNLAGEQGCNISLHLHVEKFPRPLTLDPSFLRSCADQEVTVEIFYEED